ncbi:protein adenylyltransferase SelO [Alcanivorax sp.]|uniref:protein adenylyltransferase SelO n=1 Tax=Alcanivorax sp. TaxID=1872427 RepID=UPI0025C057D6|nr:YdiU family protein [Alcanivorax sp.]
MSPTYGFQFDNSYARLPEALFSLSAPQPVAKPDMVLFNHALADELGLDADALAQQPDWFSGNTEIPGSTPLAQAYAGHQFGNLTMLGDGRAILLGEHLTEDGRRRDIQLKGGGRTPFSRGGDGRAALGPMLREYVISEAMHGLGIPTSRSLAVVANGEPVYRDQPLPGAILTRVAASHLRVGTFQYAAAQQDPALMDTLIDYTLHRHYPDQQGSDNPALALLNAVIAEQIALVTHWMRVGFIHGVLNTDNVTLSGETIDYGPCAFMDRYDQDTVFSSIDRQSRYAFGNQPAITQWNLTRFAETLLSRMDDDVDRAIEMATERLKGWSSTYDASWLAMMRNKLGLTGKQAEDESLITDLLSLMQLHKADYTNTFRLLIGGQQPQGQAYNNDAFASWHARWLARLEHEGNVDDSWARMRQNNPAIIPRNHQVEKALQAAEEDGDLSVVNRLLAALSDPYADRDAEDPYVQPPKEDEVVCATFCGT